MATYCDNLARGSAISRGVRRSTDAPDKKKAGDTSHRPKCLSQAKPTGRRSGFRGDRRSEQGHRGARPRNSSRRSHRQRERAHSQIKLLAGDCGVCFELAPIDVGSCLGQRLGLAHRSTAPRGATRTRLDILRDVLVGAILQLRDSNSDDARKAADEDVEADRSRK